jgi:hypothetical protein
MLRTPYGLLLLALSGTAYGAEITSMPPALGIAGTVVYEGLNLSGGLEEGGERISDRKVERHDLDFVVEFAPIAGVAVVLDVAHTPFVKYSFPGANSMIYEPVTGGGTYLFGTPDKEPPSVQGTGLNGVWLGLAAAPFSEQYNRSHQATWRMDLAWRTSSRKSNLWTVRGDQRGAAPGGSAWRLGAAFSGRTGVADPYLAVRYQREGPVRIRVRDERGIVYAKGVALRPASHLGVHAGTELVAFEDEDSGQRTAAEVFTRFGYRSWEDVSSGVYLPNVLDGSRSIPVTAGDNLSVAGGAGISIHFDEMLRARAGLQVGYETPYVPEHVYAVQTTPGTIRVGWYVSFRAESPLARKTAASEAPESF